MYHEEIRKHSGDKFRGYRTESRVGLSPEENEMVLSEFDEIDANIDLINEIQSEYLSKIGTRFVFLSDEFYIIANRELLEYDEYEGFIQFENGVGMISKLEREIKDSLENLKIQQDIISRDAVISVYPLASITKGEKGVELC